MPRLVRVRETLLTDARARLALVTAAFLAVAVVQTWPQLARFNSSVLGAPGDVPNGIRVWWAVHAQHGNPFTMARDFLVNAPDGVPLNRTAYIANGLFQGFWWFGGLLVGWIPAYNTFNLIALVTAGVAGFALLYRLRFGFLPAVFGGYVLAFNPNHLEKVYSSAPLAATGVLPLVVIALLRKRERPTQPRSLVVGLLVVTAFFLDSYLGLFALWLVAVFAAVELALPVRGQTRFAVLRSYYLATLTWVIGMGPAALAWAGNTQTVNAVAASRTAPLQGGFASFQLFLLPGPRNPWFGGPMRSWLHSNLAWESTMFVGYTTLVLALVGVGIAVAKHRRGALGDEARFVVSFAVVLVVSSVWAALPPSLGFAGVHLPVLQTFLAYLTTLFRVFARFGVLAMLGLVVLAAYALANIPRSRTLLRLVPAVAILAVVFELYVPRPRVVTVQRDITAVSIAQIGESMSGRPVLLSLSKPPTYSSWLAHQAPGIVADYPAPGNPDLRWAWKDLYYQTFHHHPLWQIATTSETLQDSDGLKHLAENLQRPITPLVLAAGGVKYVVLHTDRYRALGEKIPVPRRACGLRVIRRFPKEHAVVFRVTAAHGPGWVARGVGFNSIANKKLWPESAGFSWIGDTARFTIFWPKADDVVLSANSVSLDVPRQLSVEDASRRIVGAWTIAPTETTFNIPLHVHPGLNAFTFTVSPRARVRGFGDGRKVSVAMVPLQVASVHAAPASAQQLCRR